MGFFKETKTENSKKDKEPELITDPNQLFVTFDGIQLRKKHATDESGGFLSSTYVELMGNNRDIKGQFASLRNLINITYGIKRMTIGQEMVSCMENSEKYIMWNSQYTDYMEELIAAYVHICNSSFKIIRNTYLALNESNLEVARLKEEMQKMNDEIDRVQAEARDAPEEVVKQPRQIRERPPLTEVEKVVIKEKAENYISRYKQYKIVGDNRGAGGLKGLTIALTAVNPEMKEIIDPLLEQAEVEIEEELRKKNDEPKKILNPSPENAPDSRNQIPEKAL